MASKVRFSDYDFIRFTWSDIHGIQRGQLIPACRGEEIVKNGISVYAGCTIFGTRSDFYLPEGVFTGYGNGLVKALPETLKHLPWAGLKPNADIPGRDFRVGNILCESFLDDVKRNDCCPRFIARRQLEQLQEEFGYKLKAGLEHEFVMMKLDTKEPTFDGCDVMANIVHYKHENLLYSISENLSKYWIKVESMHSEHGPGKFEIITTPMMGIEVGDASFMLKQATKEICHQHGILATFMTFPYEDTEVRNATHFNHSLIDFEGNNVFHDDGAGKRNMSTISHQWTAGLLAHARALTALLCPTVNCYKKMGHKLNPDKVNWGYDNRKSMVRIKDRGSFIEYRLPTAASNTYLVIAGIMAAGMDGLRQKLGLPKPMATDAVDIPRNLDEALGELEKDEVLRRALGSNFIDLYSATKRELEVKKVNDAGLQKFREERELYLEFV